MYLQSMDMLNEIPVKVQRHCTTPHSRIVNHHSQWLRLKFKGRRYHINTSHLSASMRFYAQQWLSILIMLLIQLSLLREKCCNGDVWEMGRGTRDMHRTLCHFVQGILVKPGHKRSHATPLTICLAAAGCSLQLVGQHGMTGITCCWVSIGVQVLLGIVP